MPIQRLCPNGHVTVRKLRQGIHKGLFFCTNCNTWYPESQISVIQMTTAKDVKLNLLAKPKPKW